MSETQAPSAAFSGDLGWDDAEDTEIRGFSSALFVAATGVVWSSIWLLSGFPGLFVLVSHVHRGRGLGSVKTLRRDVSTRGRV